MKDNLDRAKAAKHDEFYTMYEDIEKEIVHYKEHLKGKIIYCNCDSKQSNFYKYFVNNFIELGLKGLVCTHYNEYGNSYVIIYDSVKGERIYEMQGNGDFRSSECIEILKQADIIITNPPFSLFREFVGQLMEYDKDFIVIGNQNAITYKEIFPLIKDNKLFLGYNHVNHFIMCEDYELFGKSYIDEHGRKIGVLNNVVWFNSIKPKDNNKLNLYKHYTPEAYPKYDNYDAINIDKVKDIPVDYTGIMGVPITFLDKYNPEQFEIITLGVGEHNFTPTKKYKQFIDARTGKPSPDKRDYLLYIKDSNGKYLTTEGYRVTKCYARILIKHKNIGGNR